MNKCGILIADCGLKTKRNSHTARMPVLHSALRIPHSAFEHMVRSSIGSGHRFLIPERGVQFPYGPSLLANCQLSIANCPLEKARYFQCTMHNAQWTMDNGRLTMDDFRCESPRIFFGDVAQLVEAAVSEAVRCGFDSLHHYSQCGVRNAECGLKCKSEIVRCILPSSLIPHPSSLQKLPWW